MRDRMEAAGGSVSTARRGRPHPRRGSGAVSLDTGGVLLRQKGRVCRDSRRRRCPHLPQQHPDRTPTWSRRQQPRTRRRSAHRHPRRRSRATAPPAATRPLAAASWPPTRRCPEGSHPSARGLVAAQPRQQWIPRLRKPRRRPRNQRLLPRPQLIARRNGAWSSTSSTRTTLISGRPSLTGVCCQAARGAMGSAAPSQVHTPTTSTARPRPCGRVRLSLSACDRSRDVSGPSTCLGGSTTIHAHRGRLPALPVTSRPKGQPPVSVLSDGVIIRLPTDRRRMRTTSSPL